MINTKKVSVIIPTYNRRDSVGRALRALNRQSFPFNEYEVIVSIDGSEDGTKEMVDSLHSDFNLISVYGNNSGRASAINKGIRMAQGKIIIVLDDDMEPATCFIEAHYIAHQDNMKLGIIGAAPIFVNEDSPLVVHYLSAKFNSHLNKLSKPGYKIRIRDFYSGNFSIRKNVLVDVGAFNEMFKIYGNEDVELAHRLLKAGVELKYSSKAHSTQFYEKNFKGAAYDRIAAGQTAVLLVNKYPDTFDDLRLREYNYVGWKWRTLRLSFIWLTKLFPKTTDLLIYIITICEKSNYNIQERLYSLALDYFFWLGVWIAISKNKNNTYLVSKIKSYKRPQVCLIQ